jgi:oligopeptide transport system substrate-binding protein
MSKVFRTLSILVIATMLMAGCASQPAPTQAPTDAPKQAEPTSAPKATEMPAATQAPEATEPPAAAEPKVITGQMGANDPRSIDPGHATDARDSALVFQFFPGLAILDIQTNEVTPAMATSWDVSADGTVYTFHLLEKVPWVTYDSKSGKVVEVKDDSGNVRYVTAKDFVYGFTRSLDPETGSPAAYILAPYVKGGEDFNAGKGKAEDLGLKAVDDYTFEITAPEKVGFVLGIYSILNARAVPEWAVEKSGDSWTEPENISTFGPFALKTWEHEASLTLIKNPFWPGNGGEQQAKIDEVTLKFLDEVVGLRDFEAGSMDWTIVPGDQIERLKSDATLSTELSIVPGVCTQAWGFNTKKAPFDNVHIRKAFNFAIDRETLVTNVLTGGQIPGVFFTPPSVAVAPSATDAMKGLSLYDAAKAKEELALGLKDLGLASADKLPKIAVEFGTSNELSAVAQALQAMWQETLGVKVDLQQVDNTVYWSKQEKDAGQIFRAGWCPDYYDTNNYLRDVYRSDSIYNYGKWTNTEFDKLVDEARVETDQAKRLEKYTRAEQLLNFEDSAIMVLYYPVRAQMTRTGIERTFSNAGTEYYWDWDLK